MSIATRPGFSQEAGQFCVGGEPPRAFCTQSCAECTLFEPASLLAGGAAIDQTHAQECAVRRAAAHAPSPPARPARRSAPAENAGAPSPGIPRGGSLVASVRNEPRSFNRLTARETTTDLLSNLTQAKLVRINKVTQDVEPWLAESWTRSEDGRRYTLKLRPGVVFSDGQPFTSADVVFTFKAVYDEKTGSNLADSLTGERQEAGGDRRRSAHGRDRLRRAVCRGRASARQPADSAAGTSSRRRSRPGRMGDAWSLSTPPSDIVGLGPFVLSDYVPGQRLVFDRQPALLPQGDRTAARCRTSIA